MSLLSSAQDRQIRDAVKLVTDTFMVTPIEYYLSKGTADRWGEDSAAEGFTKYDLNGLVEWDGGAKADEIVAAIDGSFDFEDVKITFNLEDLETAALINPDYSCQMQQGKDYFRLKGKMYKVLDVFADGPLSEKDVLIVVKGKLSVAAKAKNVDG